MADSPDAVPDREDPVLVRPYIKTAGVAAQERAPEENDDEVWPETASLPDAPQTAPADPFAEADTAVQPAVPAAPPPYGLGVAPRLLILAAGVVVALAVVAFVLFDADPPDPRRPSSVLPAVTGPAATPANSATPGSPATSAGPSASASPSPSLSASAAQPSVSVSAPATAPPPTAPTATPPPAVDRTGPITAAGGRCLALGGLLGIDGSPVQVYGCMDISAQRFTLAADGTLRVGGKCARPNDDASVRVAGCDAETAGQWRAGPDGTLVNGDQCLTDPGRAGANVRVAACGGGPEQTWTLP